MAKQRKKKKVIWNLEAEEFLCEIWMDRIAEMKSRRKNTHIYKSMALTMLERGLHFTPAELHVKLNNLTAKYKKEKLLMDSSGTPDWPLYYKVHAILCHGSVNKVEEDREHEESISDDYSLDWKPFDGYYSTQEEFAFEDSVTEISNPECQNIVSPSSSPDWFQIQVLSGLQKLNERIDREAEDRQADLRAIILLHESQQAMDEKIIEILTQMSGDNRNFQRSLLLALNKNH